MPLPATLVHETMQRAAMPTFPNGSVNAGKLSMLFRIRNAKTKALIKEHRLICMPSTFQKDTEGRTQLYYTKEGIYVDTPMTSAVGLVYFTIAGTTLYRGITAAVAPTPSSSSDPIEIIGVAATSVVGVAQTITGSGAVERGSLVDGAAAIKDLEDTILAYFFPAKSRWTPGIATMDELQLEFLNLNAPTSSEDQTGLVGYQIHPHRNLVTLRQDARQPFLWHYVFQFAGLRSLDSAALAPLDDFVEVFTAKETLADTVLARLSELTDVNSLMPPLPDLAAPLAKALWAQGVNPGTLMALSGQLSQQGLVGLGSKLLGGLKGVSVLTQGSSFLSGALDWLKGAKLSAETFLAPFGRIVQNVGGAVRTFLRDVSGLQRAVTDFLGGVTQRILFPLRMTQSIVAQVGGVLTQARRDTGGVIGGIAEGIHDILNLPSHSVQSLGQAARGFSTLLEPLGLGRSTGGFGGGLNLFAGINDRLTLAINGERSFHVDLGTVSGGPNIAQAVQEAIRAHPPDVAANAAAYRDFTATYHPETGRYELLSGTMATPAASVVSVAALVRQSLGLPPIARAGEEPTTANDVLKLGAANGGEEQQGSAEALEALEMLRRVWLATERLSAFPEYFAEALPQLTSDLQALQVAGVPGEVLSGGLHLDVSPLTPGDVLASVGGRTGVAWETLALANHLQYPYVLEAPTILLESRVSTATARSLTDTRQHWSPRQFEGQRVLLQGGAGAGQSRRIVSNDAITLWLDLPWTVEPNVTTDYAIEQALNPIVQVGTVTEAGPQTVTDTTLALVPECQRGLLLLILTGQGSGQKRRIRVHSPQTYLLEEPWAAIPAPGARYAVVRPQAPVRRIVAYHGELLAVPRPSVLGAPRTVRTPLIDLATVSGQPLDPADVLLGTDLWLEQGCVQMMPHGQDLARVTGLANLRQAVLNLLNVRLGDLDYAPGLGSYVQESLGMVATLPSQTELLHSVERTVRQDARIASFGPAQLATRGGQVEIAFVATAISGDTMDRVVIR